MKPMKRVTVFPLCLLVVLLALGCNSSTVRAKGRLIRGGQPYLTGEGEALRIFFVPLEEPKGGRFDSYAAAYFRNDGSFQVMGKDQQGLPPGKYRVSLELIKKKEDLLGGKLMGKDSPFTCEVTSSRNELVIDLDKANFDSLLEQNRQKRGKG
jgi:hypothetical protein